MVITLLLKWYTYGKFEQSLKNQNITYSNIQTKPTPLNTILWSANVQREDEYKIGYYSLLDKNDSIQFQSYPKNLELIKGYEENSYIKRLIKLSQGWYTISQEGETLYFNDLRFGIFGMSKTNSENEFVFRYKLVFNSNKELVDAVAQDPQKEKMKPLFMDLIQRVKGNK